MSAAAQNLSKVKLPNWVKNPRIAERPVSHPQTGRSELQNSLFRIPKQHILQFYIPSLTQTSHTPGAAAPQS